MLTYFVKYIAFKTPFTIVRQSSKLKSVYMNSILENFKNEIENLRGTPELVDKLENLRIKNPGVELNIDLYRILYPFKLDDFQEKGLLNLISGRNVLVSTPTGSGKTVIGELAIYFALLMGLKVAYTTPLKALSNQKFQDFSNRFGGDRVGLLTGDIVINRGAPILVMTTEVFRNILYSKDPENNLSSLFMVCLDEFHFMNDPDRGSVWEECIISCPQFIRILALSATMGNVNDIKGWISSIHGPTELIVSDHRPVPLRYLYAMRNNLLPYFRDPNAGPGAINGLRIVDGKFDVGTAINPSILKLEEQALQNAQKRLQKSQKPVNTQSIVAYSLIPTYSGLISELRSLKMLPAIVFIFSRLGCEDSARDVLLREASLLTSEETAYVNEAIKNFVSTHPDIPISKSSVQALRNGIAVHHAGLIPVWKGFIEDLFNANKIKALFATETLAAGVNLPARTTVISAVTKRVRSETVKLKTSQLLQMAGRAGRRGKDIEGTVVILRNKFEDVKASHKILTSSVDGIKSHFKISYGIAVKLLESRSIEDCKSLIERGFGSFILQTRVEKKELVDLNLIESYRSVLKKYTLQEAKAFFKLFKLLEKEYFYLKYLHDKLEASDLELVEAIADYMPLGVAVKLRNGYTGYFLGDVNWGDNNRNSGFGIIMSDHRVVIVNKEHIKAFGDPDNSIPARKAKDLLDLVTSITTWKELDMEKCERNILVGYIQDHMITENENIKEAMNFLKETPSFPESVIPNSIVKQKLLIDELERDYKATDIYVNNDKSLVLDALRYVSTLKDPLGFVNLNPSQVQKSSKSTYAWTMFQKVLLILREFNAIDGYKPIDLGRLISSLNNDNELWVALVIRHEKVSQLNPAELAAVISAIVVSESKGKNSNFKRPPSKKVQEIYDELYQLSFDLNNLQKEIGIEFPIHLYRDIGGLVESWVNGMTWRELCKSTSMDQGDICRIFRTTVDILRQITVAYGIPPQMSDTALDAVLKMNRFPVSDSDLELPDFVALANKTSEDGVEQGDFEDDIDDSYQKESTLGVIEDDLEFSKSLFDDDEYYEGEDADSIDGINTFDRLVDENDETLIDEDNTNLDEVVDKVKHESQNDIDVSLIKKVKRVDKIKYPSVEEGLEDFLTKISNSIHKSKR